MRTIIERLMPLFEGEGAGGGAGAGAGAGAGEGGGAGAGGGWTPPQGLPAEFVGADANETLTKLAGGYVDLDKRFGGLREKLSKMPTAPEKPEGYVYSPSEKLKPYLGDVDKDPAFAAARQAFHKHGIPTEAFGGVIEDLYGPLIEQGVIAAPFDPAKEVQTFQTAYGFDREKAAAALTEADTFAKGLTAQLKDVPEPLKKDVEALMLGLTDTAAGNVLLRSLSGRLAENGIRIAGEGGAQGALTAADIQRLNGDPRIDPANRNHPDNAKRFDPELRKKFDDYYKANSGKK